MALIELDPNPSKRDLKLFALIWFPALFAVVGGLVLYHSGSFRIAALIWCGALLVSFVGLLVPLVMRLVYVGLSYALFPIGWAISGLLLASIYFLVITPIGLVMRPALRRTLQLRWVDTGRSRWEPYEPPESVERYFGQS